MSNHQCIRLIESRQLSIEDEPGKTIFDDQAYKESLRCLSTHSCDSCNLCKLMCPDMAITKDPETSLMRIDLQYCKGCGICASVCPKGAIEMVLEYGRSEEES